MSNNLSKSFVAIFQVKILRVENIGLWICVYNVDEIGVFWNAGNEVHGMKVLVIGGGGREHALVWKLKQSARVEKIWCAPGNAGIAAEAECVAVDSGDVAALVALAEKIEPDLTVVGPELPLVDRDCGCVCGAEMGDCGADATGGATGGQQDFFEGVCGAAQYCDGENVWGVWVGEARRMRRWRG